MSHPKVHNHYQTMTRKEVAVVRQSSLLTASA
jgi:hypothetical protein